MSDYSITTPKGPYNYSPSKLRIGPNEETIVIYGEDVMTELDIVERLNENIIADAFESRAIVDGALCERLIRERREAAETIEKLRAALSDIYEITSRAGHLVDAVKRVAAAALNDVKSDKS